MNQRLRDVVDAEFERVRSGGSAVNGSLLALLLLRYSHRHDESLDIYDDLLATDFGDETVTIAITPSDVRELNERLERDFDSFPPRNRDVVSWIVIADPPPVAAAVAALSQYERPLTANEEDPASLLVATLYDYANEEHVRSALERWRDDLGDLGVAARDALVDKEHRQWATIDELIDDAIDAIRHGSAHAPAIIVLGVLGELAQAESTGSGEVDGARELLAEYGKDVPTFKLDHARALDAATRAVRVAGADLTTVDPLAAILVATASEETVPLLLETLRRNDRRSGYRAKVTEDTLLEALAPYAHQDDVRAALTGRGDTRP